MRIDGTDDVPIAAMPIFGEHGTLNGEDNPFASTDAPGALERVFQEQFDTPGRRHAPAERRRRQLADRVTAALDCNEQAGRRGRSVLLVGRPKRATAAPRRRR